MIDQGRIDEIRHLEFSRVFRGYEPREVDDTLVRISDEMTELLAAYRAQSEQLARVEGLVSELEKKEKLLSDTLLEAKLQAQNTLEAARKEAGEVIRDADMSAREILSDAEERRRRAEDWFARTRESWLLELARIKKDTGEMVQTLENLEAQWNVLSWPPPPAGSGEKEADVREES